MSQLEAYLKGDYQSLTELGEEKYKISNYFPLVGGERKTNLKTNKQTNREILVKFRVQRHRSIKKPIPFDRTVECFPFFIACHHITKDSFIAVPFTCISCMTLEKNV